MSDEQLQNIITALMDRRKHVCELSDEEFKSVVGGLSRVYIARVLNCVDASGKDDNEWLMLHDVFDRIADMTDG